MVVIVVDGSGGEAFRGGGTDADTRRRLVSVSASAAPKRRSFVWLRWRGGGACMAVTLKKSAGGAAAGAAAAALTFSALFTVKDVEEALDGVGES